MYLFLSQEVRDPNFLIPIVVSGEFDETIQTGDDVGKGILITYNTQITYLIESSFTL